MPPLRDAVDLPPSAQHFEGHGAIFGNHIFFNPRMNFHVGQKTRKKPGLEG
jgi:hypothetical protein